MAPRGPRSAIPPRALEEKRTRSPPNARRSLPPLPPARPPATAHRTISNITAGNKDQIQSIIDAGIIPPLIHLLGSAEFDIKKEAAWAISNATSGGSHIQIRYMVEMGCIKPLCDLLVCNDARIVTVALEGLENILKVGVCDKEEGGQAVNPYAERIHEAEGLEKIEQLQTHNNDDIYNKAVKILETYFGLEDDEDQNVAPAVDTQRSAYAFGAPQTALPPGGFSFGGASSMQ